MVHDGSVREAADPILTAAQAHNEAMYLSMPAVVAKLVELLGATTVAAITDVKETRAVQQWINGQREPQRPHVLRFALQLTLMICNLTSRERAQAWFHGVNPALDDRIPIAVLRDRPLEEAQFALMCAARAFAEHSLD